MHELHEALEPLEGATAFSGGSQPAAAGQGNGKPKPATSQKSSKHSAGQVGLPKQLTEQLWKLLPAACSYYGHTFNAFRYQIYLSQLGLDQKGEQILNRPLPDWAAKKVSSRLKPDPADASTKVVSPWKSAEFLIESTLFKGGGNQYFWACMNSPKPHLKRSLYELIERRGKPIDLILNCSVLAFMRGNIN